jgi:hypothetical protein
MPACWHQLGPLKWRNRTPSGNRLVRLTLGPCQFRAVLWPQRVRLQLLVAGRDMMAMRFGERL